MKIIPRDYQEIAVTGIRKAFRDKLAPVCFQLATGGGKTFTFCFIAANAAAKGNSTIIIVHRNELLTQASRALHALGIQHGLISPHFTPDPHQRVQVASIDTLLIRMKKFPSKYKFDLIVFDEAHHVTEKNKWGRAYEMLGRPNTLGVTATPSRSDGIGMGAHAGGIFRSMVVGPPISQLIERGMLINPVVYAGKIIPDFSKLKPGKDGELNIEEVAAITDKRAITGNAVEHYTAICPGARAVVFCANITHCVHVAAQFCEAGYNFKVLVGEPHMKQSEREQVIKDIASGAIDGVCACDLISEGLDIPGLICAILLRHLQSIGLFLQQIGRIMRPAPGKDIAYVLDHVGNIGVTLDGKFIPKHGLPGTDREWTLEGRKKGKKKPPADTIKLKQCPKCYFVFEPAPVCPACGAEMPVTARREAEEVEGTLGIVTEDMARIQQIQRRREIGQARTLAELEEYAKRAGYSKGWAWHTYNSRKGK
jgi:DNA repair protein RadD